MTDAVQNTHSVRALTGEAFDEEIGGSPVPVVVDFWAEWCPPCHALAPILDEIAGERPDDVRIFSVDVDAHPGVAARFGVMSFPTLLVFDPGREPGPLEPVKRLVGARGKRHLLAELADVLDRPRPADR